MRTLTFSSSGGECHNPTLRECEDETHTPEMGTWESPRTAESLEFDCKGQNTSHWGVLHIIEKLSKCRCPKWGRTTHLDIYNTSYGQKKGRESNWQSRELTQFPCVQVACDMSLESSRQGLQLWFRLIPIGGLHQKVVASPESGPW
jgi:hypothetical protein